MRRLEARIRNLQREFCSGKSIGGYDDLVRWTRRFARASADNAALLGEIHEFTAVHRGGIWRPGDSPMHGGHCVMALMPYPPFRDRPEVEARRARLWERLIRQTVAYQHAAQDRFPCDGYVLQAAGKRPEIVPDLVGPRASEILFPGRFASAPAA